MLTKLSASNKIVVRILVSLHSMLKKLVIILFFCAAAVKGFSFTDDQVMEIGIFRSTSLYSVVFKPADNNYRIYDKNDSI